MPAKIAFCLFLVILLPALGHAQYVYGDLSTKKYYSIECGESDALKPENRKGFKSPADAEKDGFTKGPTCVPATVTPIVARNSEQSSQKRWDETILVRELRKDSVTIEMIETDFGKYSGSRQKFVGQIRVSPDYLGKYEYRQRDMWAFSLCDDTSCGWFYMPKNYLSDSIRKEIMDPTRTDELIWICRYAPRQMLVERIVLGEIFDCESRVLTD